MFFDIHSHILPGVDDGPKTFEQSIELLKMLKDNGVHIVAATPHFDANFDSLEDFLSRRKAALELMREQIKNTDLPEIISGCEVLYFRGLSKIDCLPELCYENSNCVLIEFPDLAFTDTVIDEITELRENGFMPIIAHVERYADQKGYKKLLELIKKKVCFAQVNAAALSSKVYHKAAFKLVKKGVVSFIASDTHSAIHRPPMIKNALETIEKRFGKEVAARFVNNSVRFSENYQSY